MATISFRTPSRFLNLLEDVRYGRLAISHRRALRQFFQRLESLEALADTQDVSESELRTWLHRPIPGRLLSKGDSSVERLQRKIVRDSADDASSQASAVLLQRLRAAVQLNPSDMDCLGMYIRELRRSNRDVLRSLDRHCGSRVVLHVSCAPRLTAARRSVASFSKGAEIGFSSVVCVGGGINSELSFDSHEAILSLPCSDAYESLPSKVAAAMSVLSLVRNVQVVLKVDDDHRLASTERLNAFATALEHSRVAEAAGARVVLGHPFDHHRGWHFGKCTDERVNQHAFAAFPPPEFARGGLGYLVNRPALRAVFGGELLAADYIASSLYEDMCISGLIASSGGRVRDLPIGTAVGVAE